MRRFVLLLCAVVCAVLVRAQGLGDYMEIDGVPGFVFYLDDSGEHGLVMSFCQITEKDLKKLEKGAKKRGLSINSESYSRLVGSSEKKIKVSSKDKKTYHKELAEILGDEGKQNRAVIADYCKEKNLDLAIFKGQDFAARLGEGWYIPGVKELTLFAEFFAGGIGKDYAYSRNRYKELSNDPMVQSQLSNLSFFPVLSSSIKDPSWGFRVLIPMMPSALKMSTKHHFEMVDKVKETKFTNMPAENHHWIRICAVHEF